MLCDDGDGCDDETESKPVAICIVTIVTTVTFEKNNISLGSLYNEIAHLKN